MSQGYKQTDMPTTISVSETIADELYNRKDRGESYNDVLDRVLRKADAYESDSDLEDMDPTRHRAQASASVTDASDDPPVDDLVEAIGYEILPGQGQKLDQRVAALRATVDYLREHGRATPQEFKNDVYPDHSAMYVDGKDPARSWWKNCIYKGMSAVAEQSECVQAAGADGKWCWVGESDGR